MSTKTPVRKWMAAGTVLLAAAVVAGVAFIWRNAGSSSSNKERLLARVEEYKALRLANDWAGLYAVLDPLHQKAVDMSEFLRFFAHGVIQIHGIETRSVEWTPGKPEARAILALDGELIPGKLPASVRKGFKEEHPEHLRRTSDFPIIWVWRDKDWFFQLDEEIISGRTAKGETVTPVESKKSN